MNIGILSGKGGTGKTLLSTNLAVAMNGTYVDCDVEEPNGFIFLKPEGISSYNVLVDYPVIDEELCVLCGNCVEVCEFNALAKTKRIFVFEKLCHSCGGCEMVCPTNAIKYEKRKIGVIDKGTSGNITCKRGVLEIGEAMAVPVIKELLGNLEGDLNIIDCAPGTSCNVVTSLEHVDKAILITEPTEFGLHDFKRAVKLCEMFKIPHGVVINRVSEEDNIISRYCDENNIEILSSIPYEKKIAEIYSKGELIVTNDEYKRIFTDLVEKIGDLK